MHEVTKESIKAFLNHRNGKFGGISQYDGLQNTTVKDDVFYLHDNAIMKLVNNELFIRVHTNSVITRRRINGLSCFGYNVSLVQRKFKPILNGETVTDLYKWYKINKK